MPIYVVYYEGLWIGGAAVVRARTKEKAIELVKNHEDTVEFKNVKCETRPDRKEMVLYNDNGDY